MGRHSGAVCSACQQRVLVRDDRLVEHWHRFPTLDRALPCVGSRSKVADDWAWQEWPTSSPDPGRRVRRDPARIG